MPPGPGVAREVTRLVDEAELGIMTIVLRDGTPLPDHQFPVAVTIQALSGVGTVTANGSAHPIDSAHAVVLSPSTVHSVVPTSDEPLVLLVHHSGQSR